MRIPGPIHYPSRKPRFEFHNIMAVKIKIPSIGESISEVEIGTWLKNEGDSVQKDENLVVIESEKASIELPAPSAGTLSRILKKQGETVAIGTVIGEVEETASASAKQVPGNKKSLDSKTKRKAQPKSVERAGDRIETSKERAKPPFQGKAIGSKQTAQRAEPATESSGLDSPLVMPAARRLIEEHQLDASDISPTGPGGRILKEDVLRHLESGTAVDSEAPDPIRPGNDAKTGESGGQSGDDEEVVAMSPLRRTVARRLVEAQQQAALLTTFNEIDMSATMAMRKQFQDLFQKKHGVRLGFMSFFVKAAVEALRLIPQVNAEVRGTDIVYRNHYDIGVAIGGGKGLVVPVIRRAERLGFAEIELVISDFSQRARENKLTLDELRGGTFTISNGGIYGSLLSTPIVNPPQSGILGMHTIQDRPCAVDGQVVIRPMMYVALTYDHRIVDGREAVTFLKRIKDVLETPERLLLEV